MQYKSIVEHYENCLNNHGDNHLGVDWPNIEDAHRRYKVMLELIPKHNQIEEELTLLDFGCGAAHFYDYLNKKEITNVKYYGLDLSDKFISLCKRKYPQLTFFQIDILQDEVSLPNFDYILLNGVFTEKRDLSFDEMFNYFQQMIKKLYPMANKGLAFNVMSKHVDWERNDLFHLSFDLLAEFLIENISRDFIFRNDYKLYEYTTYLFK